MKCEMGDGLLSLVVQESDEGVGMNRTSKSEHGVDGDLYSILFHRVCSVADNN
jgi:hypothetical protein